MNARLIRFWVCLLICLPASTAFAADYRFDSNISREVLENYLSRSITMEGLLNGRGDLDDNIRMLKHTGAKFIGRSLCLWGGETNAAGRPWQEDTIAVLFSGTKGLVATALLTLVDEGRLRLNDRVADYWPAFAAAGKTDITVAQLGAHAAGLPYLSQVASASDMADLTTASELLA